MVIAYKSSYEPRVADSRDVMKHGCGFSQSKDEVDESLLANSGPNGVIVLAPLLVLYALPPVPGRAVTPSPSETPKVLAVPGLVTTEETTVRLDLWKVFICGDGSFKGTVDDEG